MSAVVGIDLSSFALDLVKPMAATDAAWLAGFLDGEASFQITRSSRRVNYDAGIAVGNVSLAALERCRDLAGGSIARLGQTNAAWKQYYKWEIRGKTITPTITAILPYLVIKREQAEILMVLRLSAEVGARLGKSTLSVAEIQWRETLKRAVNALNQRGSSPPPQEAVEALAIVRAYLARNDGQLSFLRSPA